MAFKDSDGKITIDEVAAERDVAQLRKSIEKMTEAASNLDEIIAQTEEFEGNTGTQIREVSMKMKLKVNKSISDMEEAIENIQNTVKKYQRIDAEIKNVINNKEF